MDVLSKIVWSLKMTMKWGRCFSSFDNLVLKVCFYAFCGLVYIFVPETLPDATVNLMVWHCTIPGKAGVRSFSLHISFLSTLAFIFDA